MKVYTKTGDNGTTSLVGGERVPKCDMRVEAYGTVDELAAQLAMLGDMMRLNGGLDGEVAEIERIQGDLMVAEATLAIGHGAEEKVKRLEPAAIERLERSIDRMSEGLEPVVNFIIPGGHPIVSQSHICRTVCRRAERATLRIPDGCTPHPEVAAYLNRLSDWLYVVGRVAVKILLVKDTYWTP